jgi:hypothetical protein
VKKTSPLGCSTRPGRKKILSVADVLRRVVPSDRKLCTEVRTIKNLLDLDEVGIKLRERIATLLHEANMLEPGQTVEFGLSGGNPTLKGFVARPAEAVAAARDAITGRQATAPRLHDRTVGTSPNQIAATTEAQAEIAKLRAVLLATEQLLVDMKKSGEFGPRQIESLLEVVTSKGGRQ